MRTFTINQLIKDNTTKLKSDLIITNHEAKLETQLLLQHALSVNRAWLIAHENDALEANIHAVFEALLNRRLSGEPIPYIFGFCEFYGLNLKVTADTLIPRPDTETLVETALAIIPQSTTSPLLSFSRRRESMVNLNQRMDSRLHRNDELENFAVANNTFRILDLGTGTGAIALAIAKHRPQTLVTAVDASQATLNIAIENAQNLNITNVHFLLSNWFAALSGNRFDMLVSNPPYIEAYDVHLKQGDLRFEPISALASGIDGLDAIRTIIAQAPQHLNPDGWLLLEHGYNQASKVADLLKQTGFSKISHCQDLAGIDRVTLGQLN